MNNLSSNHIYHPQGEAGVDPALETLPLEATGYTTGATKDDENIVVAVDALNCHAKLVYDPQSRGLKPYVKFGTFGAMADWPFDPFDPNVREGDGGKHGKKDGRSLYEFRKVSLDTFNNYLLYLKTGNKKWLHHARRARD